MRKIEPGDVVVVHLKHDTKDVIGTFHESGVLGIAVDYNQKCWALIPWENISYIEVNRDDSKKRSE